MFAGLMAAPVPAQADVVLGIVYKSTPTVDIKLDVYMPPGAGPFPAAILVHGGNWRTSWRGEFGNTARQLVDMGLVSFVVDFRMPCLPRDLEPGLDPDLCYYNFPSAVQDLHSAVAWVRDHGAQYKAITSKVGMMGSSTGGNLAMEAGVSGVAGLTRPDAVVSWSGIGDLTMNLTGNNRHRNNYVGCKFQDCPQKWRYASPSLNVGPGDAPLYLSGGELDPGVPLNDEQATIDRWTAAGVANEWHLVLGDDCHARQCWRENPEILVESAEWIYRWIAP
jgi:acetyl esterase/lipase